MGCHVSKPKYEESHTPETWIEYGRRMDLEFAEGWDEFRKRQDALRELERSTAGDLSVDDKVYLLIVETDIRVAKFSRWALNNMKFSDIHISSREYKIIERCLKPDREVGVSGQVIWRGIKDEEKPNPVITRAIELGWEPVKTRLNRILAPSTVSDCGAITWNFAQ